MCDVLGKSVVGVLFGLKVVRMLMKRFRKRASTSCASVLLRLRVFFCEDCLDFLNLCLKLSCILI